MNQLEATVKKVLKTGYRNGKWFVHVLADCHGREVNEVLIFYKLESSLLVKEGYSFEC
jgi:hypothetical protein